MAVGGPDRASASLVFRPESAAIAPAGEAPFRFRVERVQFLGARQRVWLAGEHSAGIIVDVDARKPIEPGAEVGITIDLGSVIVV